MNLKIFNTDFLNRIRHTWTDLMLKIFRLIAWLTWGNNHLIQIVRSISASGIVMSVPLPSEGPNGFTRVSLRFLLLTPCLPNIKPTWDYFEIICAQYWFHIPLYIPVPLRPNKSKNKVTTEPCLIKLFIPFNLRSQKYLSILKHSLSLCYFLPLGWNEAPVITEWGPRA